MVYTGVTEGTKIWIDRKGVALQGVRMLREPKEGFVAARTAEGWGFLPVLQPEENGAGEQSMTEATIHYRYQEPSVLVPSAGGNTLQLSGFDENEDSAPDCLFFGRLTSPLITARCLTLLSRVVQSRYTLSPETIAAMHDPIISVGNRRIRFEGFSGCAGIYARVDVLPGGLDGAFLANGTTNVDFNSLMLASLGGVRQSDEVILSVGPNEVAVGFESGTVVERKVPLPQRWLKALTSVQAYLAGAEPLAELTRVQAIKLFQGLPRGKTRGDFYLSRRASSLALAPMRAPGGIAIGGVNRLLLLEPLLAYADSLKVFAHPSGSSTTWQLYFGDLRFSFSLSREPYRGFSGEGAGLDELAGGLSPELLDAVDNLGRANETFSQEPEEYGFAWEKGFNPAPGLAAMGLLGFDLDEQAYFCRKLPFKPERLLGLNPRLKNALKLVKKGGTEISYRPDGGVQGRVPGSGVWHTVVLDGKGDRCTCAWIAKYGSSRGPCKHILAVKKLVRSSKAFLF